LPAQSHEELWLECAGKLTTMIQQIIEFAKIVPGFMKLSQDDQIVLLKSASLELSCLRMSRYFDLNSGQVLFGEMLMPMEAMLTNDPVERKLVQTVFEFAKGIAEMKLTECELALFSAYALLTPGNLTRNPAPKSTYSIVIRLFASPPQNEPG
jgi:nuclear receptor subfamily 1 group F protein 4